MTSNPPPDRLGEGVYPHSYERLGVQGGWHVTPVLFAPAPLTTQPRTVTLQVVCGPKPRRMSPPHKTTMVSPGETETYVVQCPGVRQLIGGGFQRSFFTAVGGQHITESRAASDTAWRVTGHGFGAHGAQLTGIAYCKRSKKDLMSEVSASTTVAPASVGAATTPPCPGDLTLAFGGFATDPTGSIFISNGGFNEDGSWTGSGYNRSVLPATLTVHGYCLNMRAVGKKKE